jgi:hypothetical protein
MESENGAREIEGEMIKWVVFQVSIKMVIELKNNDTLLMIQGGIDLWKTSHTAHGKLSGRQFLFF